MTDPHIIEVLQLFLALLNDLPALQDTGVLLLGRQPVAVQDGGLQLLLLLLHTTRQPQC